MKKVQKLFRRLAPKALNLFVVFLMLLQPVGTTGMIAIAQEADAVDITLPVSEPADPTVDAANLPQTETPATEAETATESAPVQDLNPIVDSTVGTTGEQTPAEENQGAIDLEAGAVENLIPVEEAPAAESVQKEKECLATDADIKTSGESDWNVDGDSAKTKDNVKLGIRYEFPGNKEVSITFTCLPKDESKLSSLKIEQIASDKIDLPEGVFAATDFAYDITTDGMDNGDFEYDLTLPKSEFSGAEVKYIEKSAEEVVSAEVKKDELKTVDETKVKKEDKTMKISELDHLTVFLTTTNGNVVTVSANAGTGADGGGSGSSWSNTGNITTDDTSYATLSISNNGNSHYLNATNYGFSIPTGATINGIQVSIMRQSSSNSGGSSINDDVVQLIKGGTRVGTDKGTSTDWPTTMSVAGYGSASDLWSTTWTPADINASNFGVALSGHNQSFTSSRTASVDYMQITVTYTAAAPADTTPPTVTINQAVGQADPTTASPINFTVVFSEVVADFATGDVTLSGTAGATTATVTGSGTTYNVAVSGMTSGGTVVANIAAGVANDAAGNDNLAATFTDNTVDYGTPYVPVAGNLIQNPSFENGSGDDADNWSTSAYGSNNSAFSIVSGHSGSRAGQINTTVYTDGDAKWVHQAVPVSGGQYYKFAFWYKSSVAGEVDFLYNGTDWQWNADLPIASNWTKYETDLLIPNGVTSLQIIPLITGIGTFTSDDYSMVLGTAPVFGTDGMVSLSFDDGLQNIYDNAIPVLTAANLKSTQYINTYPILHPADYEGYMTPAELQTLQSLGHDIAGHTRTHADLTTLDAAGLISEINGNKSDLQAWNITPVDSLAYPYGSYNDTVISAVESAGFVGARTVEQGYNFTNTDKFKLKAMEVDGSTTANDVKGWIDAARLQKAWLILLFHEVKNGDCTNAPESYCTNKATLEEIVNYLKSQNMTVPTVSQGIKVMGGGVIPDTIPPVLAELTPVPTLTNDNTPNYTFNSTEAGTITYAGDCASLTTAAVAGNNTITFDTPVLADGLHTNCTITVKDAANNISTALAVSPFTVDAKLPITTITFAIDGNAILLPLDGTGHTKSNSISVTFGATDENGSGVAKLECMLDAGIYATCTSPVAYADLLDGIHTVSVRATDTAGNLGTATFTWAVDNIKPEITVLGVSPLTIQYGSVYTDAGATALDNVDGNLTNSIITVNPVNTSLLGDYTVTYNVMDVTGNVADQKTRTVSVVKADQTIIFDVITDKNYIDAPFTVNAVASSNLPVTLSARLFDPVIILGNSVIINGTGTVVITASQAGDGNYNAALDVLQTFNITKQAIIVTANTQIKSYGENDPALTYTITSGSLKSGDSFTGSLDRVAGESFGVYQINQGSLNLNSNYELTYIGANLTIGIRAIEIAADAKNKTYGDSDPALTYTITSGSLKSGDSFAGSLDRVAGEDVGSYAINQGTLALSSDYILTYAGANLNIEARAIEVVADNQTKTQGDPDPALTYTITHGLLQFSDAFAGALTRDAGEDLGSYAITQGNLALISNYILTYIGGIFAINLPPVITEEAVVALGETSATITWTTDHPATSRVVYDTVSHSIMDVAPNYGYANSTVEADNSPKVTSHSVTLTGLTSGTTYYYRSISHGSPETIGSEISFTTTSPNDNDDDDDDDNNGKKHHKKAASVTVALASAGGNYLGEASGSANEAVSEAVDEAKTEQIKEDSVKGEEGSVQGEEKIKDVSKAESLPSSSKNHWGYFIGALLLLVALGYVYWKKRKKIVS
jgi:LPXTG-motif cell wall-anchored protein